MRFIDGASYLQERVHRIVDCDLTIQPDPHPESKDALPKLGSKLFKGVVCMSALNQNYARSETDSRRGSAFSSLWALCRGWMSHQQRHADEALAPKLSSFRKAWAGILASSCSTQNKSPGNTSSLRSLEGAGEARRRKRVSCSHWPAENPPLGHRRIGRVPIRSIVHQAIKTHSHRWFLFG